MIQKIKYLRTSILHELVIILKSVLHVDGKYKITVVLSTNFRPSRLPSLLSVSVESRRADGRCEKGRVIKSVNPSKNDVLVSDQASAFFFLLKIFFYNFFLLNDLVINHSVERALYF